MKHLRSLTTALLLVLAVITATGTLLSWENLFGSNTASIGAGCTLLIIHAAANPSLLLSPMKQNTLATGRLRWAAKLGLLLLILGGLDASGVLDAMPGTPRLV